METLEMLGLSKEELTGMVVKRIADELLREPAADEEGRSYVTASEVETQLHEMIQTRIDDQVTAIGEREVLPRVTEMVGAFTLQETNRWGEKAGKTLTFTEYLVARADAYLLEKVDHGGKPKGVGDSYWRESGTRLSRLIDARLDFQTDKLMKDAAKSANESIVDSIKTACEEKLKEIVKNLKVTTR